MSDHLLPTLAARLRSTPAELAGLAVLLAGVVAVAVVLSWSSTGSPSAPGDPASPVAIGAPAGSVLAPAGSPAGSTVHVTGAVATPGVLTLPAGARVADAVRAAGGLTADADLGGLNLARPVSDGEQIVVPVVALPGTGTGGGAQSEEGGGAATADGRVDLNRASAAELEELPGVGPVLAERIVAYREEHGPFTTVGQLREVSGIGERTFQSLADLVAVG